MEDKRLDILAPKEEQLSILVPYLESVTKGNEEPLPLTMRSTVLIKRYLWYWREALIEGEKKGLKPKFAFMYYKGIK